MAHCLYAIVNFILFIIWLLCIYTGGVAQHDPLSVYNGKLYFICYMAVVHLCRWRGVTCPIASYSAVSMSDM